MRQLVRALFTHGRNRVPAPTDEPETPPGLHVPREGSNGRPTSTPDLRDFTRNLFNH